MKRNIIVAFGAALLFVGCIKEPQFMVFPHQGEEGEPYSTSLFVATDRHEAGKCSGRFDKAVVRRYSLDDTDMQHFGTTRYRNPYTIALRRGR